MDNYYTVKQASKILNVQVLTIQRWIYKGKIKAHKLDNANLMSHWRIPKSEVKRILTDELKQIKKKLLLVV